VGKTSHFLALNIDVSKTIADMANDVTLFLQGWGGENKLISS